MRLRTTSFIAIAFISGLALSPIAQHVFSDAHAQSVPLVPAMIDLMALKHADLPTSPNPEINVKWLVTTDNATIALSSGNVGKHIHPKTDEIQYIVEGSGAMWLGTERRDFKPGTIIIIPKGTPHGGTIVSSGPVKALSIKIPPQPPGDSIQVN